MREFTSEGWWYLKDRGDVASVLNDEEYENGKGHLVGETVKIDGFVYTVKGVEAYAKPIIRKGERINLLVAEPRQGPRICEHGSPIGVSQFRGPFAGGARSCGCCKSTYPWLGGRGTPENRCPTCRSVS